ncbi:MAG: AmmeMemoRadiSam system protein B [Acidobacteria bacterium]|nr:MAG: AmmeMemoRadiSam system protein B [Acidobacteriota bacterium]
MSYPKLRTNIDVIPVEHRGQRLICLRDPLGFNSGPVFLPLETLDILRLLDGQHSIVDIQAEWMRRRGELLFREEIENLVRQLDEHLLLNSPRFQAVKQDIERAFVASSVRKAAHAGESYPADPSALRQRLGECFTAEGGPGEPEHFATQNALRGIIAPHIDLRVGGPCYGWAYKQLAEYSLAETFIILGTSHYETETLFVPTRKDYETPLGVVKTDRAFIAALERHYGGSIADDDTAHRVEHSIEFQVLFLQYLYENRRPIQIVPILCGSFHEMIFNKRSPLKDPRVRRFVEALVHTMSQYEKPTCFIVGADLAHIGPKFGDPFPAQGMLDRIEREDRALLQLIEALDAEGLFQLISRDEDRRKICGFPPIYTFLAATDAPFGRLLNYQQWSEEATRSAVTYASMAFYASPPSTVR